MSNRRKTTIFKWFIENYSYCWHKNGEGLDSPSFTNDYLKGVAWHLRLYPRGQTCKNPVGVNIFLFRSLVDDGPEEFPLNYELTFNAADGSILYSDRCKKIFKKGSGYGCGKEIPMDEVILQRKSDYLPQDVLSVLCKIWTAEGIAEQFTEISARTRIEIERFSFLRVIDNFSALKPNEMRTVQIIHPAKKGCTISSSVHVTDGSCCERKIIVKTVPNSSKQILCNYKISLLNASGDLVKCGEADNRCDPARSNIDILPLSLTQKAIMDKKSEYLPDGKLSVLCECVFSNGAECTVFEKTLNEIPPMTLIDLNYDGKSSDDDDKSSDDEDLPDYPTALDDLTDVYNSQSLIDVEVKTKTKSFFAHKIILSARSSVFKVMISSEMKEKNKSCIRIDDLDDDTVQQLLLFLYSDKLENLKWETATKLYYAADKYEIKKLKATCSDFLKENLSASTATELLVLANAHNDFHLKETVQDFILEHEQEVFASDEWEKLMETDPQLVIKTMHLKYKRNKILRKSIVFKSYENIS